ncbi:uncharacterized protein BN660_00108 [Clostridium sp. CAG:448]|nr:uncharacterized protein BN660_00108 [Clostridium sp. CAG:448]
MHELLGNTGCAVQYDREAGQALGNLFQNVKAERRGNQYAVGVAGALLGLELVSAVAGADGNCQGVHAGAGDEFLDLFGARVGGIFCADLDVILDACQSAELAFHHDTVGVRIFHDLFGQGNVVLKGVMGAVDHDRRKSAVNAGFADFKIRAVVQVKRQVNAGIADGSLRQSHQVLVLCVFARTCGNLENHRGTLFLSRLGDCLDDFHVVDVERTDGITALVCFFEHFLGCYQCHILFS